MMSQRHRIHLVMIAGAALVTLLPGHLWGKEQSLFTNKFAYNASTLLHSSEQQKELSAHIIAPYKVCIKAAQDGHAAVVRFYMDSLTEAQSLLDTWPDTITKAIDDGVANNGWKPLQNSCYTEAYVNMPPAGDKHTVNVTVAIVDDDYSPKTGVQNERAYADSKSVSLAKIRGALAEMKNTCFDLGRVQLGTNLAQNLLSSKLGDLMDDDDQDTNDDGVVATLRLQRQQLQNNSDAINGLREVCDKINALDPDDRRIVALSEAFKATIGKRLAEAAIKTIDQRNEYFRKHPKVIQKFLDLADGILD